MSYSNLNEFDGSNENDQNQTDENKTDENKTDENDILDYCINQAFHQQQFQIFEMFASFMTTDGKNICQHLQDIRDAILTNSRCLLKLNNTIEKYVEQKTNTNH